MHKHIFLLNSFLLVILLSGAAGLFVSHQAVAQPVTPATGVEVVFVMDTSGSMDDEFSALCGSIQSLVSDLKAEGVTVAYTILGINATRECATGFVRDDVSDATAMHEEDWGPAVSDVSANYFWKPGYVRLIIPMSDEGPYEGEPCEDPGPDRDTINIAILAAQSNNVRVAPILGSGHEDEPCNYHLAEALAQSTGGQVFFSTTPRDDLADGIKAIIGAVVGDSDGDGLADDQDPFPDDPCQPDPQKVCYPRQICARTNTPRWDDDGDGQSDEELENGQDDDGDGLVDEDVGGVGCPFPKQRCGVNNHRDFDDDGDGQRDEETPNDSDDDGDNYVDEDIFCPCPPQQMEGQETPGVDDDHDFRVDEEVINGLDDDGDGCIDEDIGNGPRILFPLHETVTWLDGPPISVNGTASPGATVALYDGDRLIDTVIADAAGEWRVDPWPLSCGANWLWAEATLNGQKTSTISPTLLLVRPDPPGPYWREGESEGGADSSFSYVDRFIATYYFYWFDETDPNDHHNLALAERSKDPETANWPANPFEFKYDSTPFHRQELEDMLTAGIDVVLPVYWGVACEVGEGAQNRWSNGGLESIVQAALILRGRGIEPPKIGMFYDTNSLRAGSHYKDMGETVDLSTLRGLERFYVPIRDFYSIVPPILRAEMDGRPLVWIFASQIEPSEGLVVLAANPGPEALEYVREQFANDFNGKIPYIIVEETTWQGAISAADNWYRWSAAQNGMLASLTIASVGPGFDDRYLGRASAIVTPRQNGQFYRDAWDEVIRSRDLVYTVVVETWNAIEEGADIWRSEKYGREYIDLTAEYALRFKALAVPHMGLPPINQPAPEFWRLTGYEKRLMQAINDRRAQSGRTIFSSPSLGAESAALSEAQLILENNIELDVPLGGWAMREGRYWLYYWNYISPITGDFPIARRMEGLVADFENAIRRVDESNRLLGRKITGVGVVCLVADNGNFGCGLVLDYRQPEIPPADISPNNDADFSQLQPGDILVNANHIENPIDFIDWTQLLGYGGLWHHAGIYVGEDQVVESGTAGVELVPVEQSSFWRSDYTAIYRVKASEATRQAAADLARGHASKPYNYNYFNKWTKNSFYCSQVPWSVYWQVSDQDIDLDQNTGTPWWLDLPGLVTPDDLVFNNLVEHVSGGSNYLIGNWHAHSPVDFYVTDPQGRRVGMDPLHKQPVVEIPGAVYNFDREPKFIAINGLLEGDYTVTLVGTDDGQYTLESVVVGALGPVSDSLSSTISKDEIVAYSVNVSTASSQAPAVALVPTSPSSTMRSSSMGLILLVLGVGALLVFGLFILTRRTSVKPALPSAGLMTAEGHWVPMSPTGLRIGRARDSDLVLSHEQVSREHAYLRLEGGVYVLWDLSSQLGTQVNGQPVQTAHLSDGDRVQIGPFDMVFRVES